MRLQTMIFAAAIAIGTLQAQSAPDLITAHFSTPVMVGGATLPAGDCSIQVLREATGNVILEVRSASGPTATVLVNRLTNSSVETNGHVSVVLSVRNNLYQLNQVVLPDHTGFQVLD